MTKKKPARAASKRHAPPPPLELEPRLSIVQAAALHRTMLERLERGAPIVIDGTHVEEIDTAVLQLLTSLWRTGRERGVACTWRGSSDALRRAATLVGVAGILQLDAAA
ncbi:MAG: STAS domain-containing protein [Steroidobacteraceae bacterium]